MGLLQAREECHQPQPADLPGTRRKDQGTATRYLAPLLVLSRTDGGGTGGDFYGGLSERCHWLR